MTIQDAVDSLYRIAVTEGKGTSPKRLDDLARYCIAELARRGLDGAVMEAKLPGGGREKSWDVAWSMDDTWPRTPTALSARSTWAGLLKSRITRLSGRRPPSWSIGMIEASLFLEVDLSEGPRLVSDRTQRWTADRGEGNP